MRTQCKLLGVARSSVGYTPVAENPQDILLKRTLDELYLRDPCLGTRRLVEVLERDHGLVVNRKRVQRLRREMGLEAIYCKPRTSVADKTHRIHPYLLRELPITRPDQVWCADITYVPMPRGHAYLCAVMDIAHAVRAGIAMKLTLLLTFLLALTSATPSAQGEDKPAGKPGEKVEKPAGKVEKPANKGEKTGKPGAGSNDFGNLLKQSDKNKDGAVTKEEFLESQPAGKDADKSREWFAKHDTNKDDKITKEDYAKPEGKQ